MSEQILADAIYTPADVRRFLQISASQYYQLRKDGLFPIPEIQPSVGRARFSGADLLRYASGAFRSVRRHAPTVSGRRR